MSETQTASAFAKQKLLRLGSLGRPSALQLDECDICEQRGLDAAFRRLEDRDVSYKVCRGCLRRYQATMFTPSEFLLQCQAAKDAEQIRLDGWRASQAEAAGAVEEPTFSLGLFSCRLLILLACFLPCGVTCFCFSSSAQRDGLIGVTALLGVCATIFFCMCLGDGKEEHDA